jgi:hypothetical protein
MMTVAVCMTYGENPSSPVLELLEDLPFMLCQFLKNATTKLDVK